jgi:riboflavin synthase
VFTGIIEEQGLVKELTKKSPGHFRLEIKASAILKGLKIGGSVAVNGACLTAVKKEGGVVHFDVIAETLRRTTLGGLRAKDRVNLERPVRSGSRFEGHFVLGRVERIQESRGQKDLYVSFPKALYPYLVEKGSVALDGVSLTLGKVSRKGFWVHLVPHTLRVTTLGRRTRGSKLNLEADILLKSLLSIDKA